jgi:hypothetical protein
MAALPSRGAPAARGDAGTRRRARWWQRPTISTHPGRDAPRCARRGVHLRLAAPGRRHRAAGTWLTPCRVTRIRADHPPSRSLPRGAPPCVTRVTLRPPQSRPPRPHWSAQWSDRSARPTVGQCVRRSRYQTTPRLGDATTPKRWYRPGGPRPGRLANVSARASARLGPLTSGIATAVDGVAPWNNLLDTVSRAPPDTPKTRTQDRRGHRRNERDRTRDRQALRC